VGPTALRRKVIAALAALVRHWKGLPVKDRPKPPFTSLPEWGEVVGGIMIACGLGNLCETDPEDFQNVVRTWRDDLLALTGMIGKAEPSAWLKTSDIIDRYITKFPHAFPIMSRYSPKGLRTGPQAQPICPPKPRWRPQNSRRST
jgi:hypothetical protein